MRYIALLIIAALCVGGSVYGYSYHWLQEKRESDQRALEIWERMDKKMDVIIERLK